MKKSLGTWLLALTSVLAVAIGLMTLFVFSRPMVIVRLFALKDGDFQLDVRRTFKTNSIMRASLSDHENKPLWKNDFDDRPAVVSIRLHDGQPADDGQLLRPLRVGEEFSVRVEYQYDSLIPPAPCAAESEYRFAIAIDGSVEYRGQAD